jgi:ribosomal protein L35
MCIKSNTRHINQSKKKKNKNKLRSDAISNANNKFASEPKEKKFNYYH